jgi:DNA-binding MarR family transcriptional regulator
MGEIPSGNVHQALLKNTGFLIARLGIVAQKQFAERMDTLDLTTRMWGALNVLDAEGEITQHRLSTCTGIDPSSMVGTIDELEKQGLVQRRRNPSDRRAHALHLTEHGRETLTRGRQLARAAQDELLAPLDPEERAQLHALLLRLVSASQAAAKEAGEEHSKAAAAGAAAHV